MIPPYLTSSHLLPWALARPSLSVFLPNLLILISGRAHGVSRVRLVAIAALQWTSPLPAWASSIAAMQGSPSA